MKKTILIGLLSFLLFNQQKVTAQEKNNFFLFDLQTMGQEKNYPRFYFETNKHVWGITAGLNSDALGLSHVEMTYKVLNGLKIAVGIAHHPYQGGFHVSTGVLFKKEFKNNFELEGYSRMIFNHTDYFGSELEFQKKMRYVSFGILTEVEIGKEFLLWKESKDKEIEKESIILLGPLITVPLTEHMSVRNIFEIGQKIKHEEKHFAYKVGVGIKYVF